MKTIKARAWDSKLQKFIYQEMVSGQIGLKVTSDDNTPLELFKNLGEWEQCTGRKDKNGLEIWEGRITNSSINGMTFWEVIDNFHKNANLLGAK